MVLKLDPRLPLLWRTPTSLQFGAETPPVVLGSVTNADERMIAALVGGVSRSGLSAIGTSAGAEEVEVVRLLDAVSSALLPASSRSPASDSTVVLNGAGPTVAAICALLRSHDISVALNETGAKRPDLAIIVAHFVIEPELHGLWLRRDVPHLAVVFGDTSVQIGPVIEPGDGPCLYCLERHRTDADAARPALASQLWGTSSPAETALASSEAAVIATRLALARLAVARTRASQPPTALPSSTAVGGAVSLHLEVDSGRISRRSWRPHPECACLALPGNDSVDARRAPTRRPMRDAAVAVPA